MQYLFNHSGILERISYAPARKTYCPVFDVGVLISEEGKH